jgi:hypothetical protein
MKLDEMIKKLEKKDLAKEETLIISSPYITTDDDDEYMTKIRTIFAPIKNTTILNFIKMITVSDSVDIILSVLTNESNYSVLRHLEYEFDSIVYAIKK